MAGILTNDEHYYAIANAIRQKLNVTTKYRPADMPSAILDIRGGENVEPITFNQNGTYRLPQNTIYDPITVNVYQEVENEELTATANGEYYPSSGKMFSKVTVNVQGVNDSDVLFIDYDGTILYSYTAQAFLNLTEMPAQGTRLGLIADGWNWELEAAKTYVQNNGGLIIGQNYITNNNETRFYINIRNPDGAVVEIRFSQSENLGVSIGWGEMDSGEPAFDNYDVIASHRYNTPGQYVITLLPRDSCTVTFSSYQDEDGNYPSVISKNVELYKIEFGKNVYLGDQAFAAHYHLEIVSMPAYINYISNGVFSSCYQLKAFVVPLGLYTEPGKDEPGKDEEYDGESTEPGKDESEYYMGISLGNQVFFNCHKLAIVSISQAVNYLGNSTFGGTSTKRLYFPSDLTYVGSYVFSHCHVLEQIYFGGINVYIGRETFGDCYSLNAFIFPSETTQINTELFNYCSSLRTVIFPDGLLSIEPRAFYECSSLLSVDIPEGTTTIGYEAFKNCTELESVIIPSTVTSMGGRTFLGSSNIKEYHFKSATPPTITSYTDEDFLDGIDGFTIYVPVGSLTAYTSESNWQKYSGLCVEESA